MNKKPLNYTQIFFLAAIFISPLLFLGGRLGSVTRNPYLIQERLLQVILVFTVGILFFKSKEYIKFPVTFLDRPLWAFFTIALISFLLSFLRYPFSWSFIHYGGRGMLMLIFSGIIPFYFAAGSNAGFRDKIKKTVIAAGSIAAAYAILQFLNSVLAGINLDFIWGEVLDPYGARSISTFGNPNFLSAYLLVVIFWIMGYIFTEKKPGRWICLMVLNTAALAITMTRSTFVGLFAGLAVLFILLSSGYDKKYLKFRKTMVSTFAVIAVIGIVFFGISDQFRSRIKGMVSVERMGSALVQRLLIWESSANMFADDPVVGRGWGNFEIFYPFYQGRIVHRKQYMPLRTHANNAHNFIMELLTQSGIPGTGIYIWLMAVFIVFTMRIYKKAAQKDKIWAAVLGAAALAFWTDNLLNVSLFFPIPALAFWVNAGLIAGMGRDLAGSPYKKINFGKVKPAIAIITAGFMAGVVYFNYIYFKSSVHFFNGLKYSRTNLPLEAEKELRRAWATYPLIVDSNYELGNVYVRLSREGNVEYLEKAAWAYREALRANPGYDEIYYNLGIVYLMKEDYGKALDYLKKALEINPVAENIYRTLGDTYGRKEKFSEAAGYYSAAIEVGLESVHLYNNLGYYLQMQNEISLALKQYVRALEFDPGFTHARSNIMRIKSSNQDVVNTPEIKRYFSEAETHINNEEWPEAMEKLQKVLDTNPASLRALIYSGNIHFQMAEPEKAEKRYRLVLSIDPRNETARRNLEAVTE